MILQKLDWQRDLQAHMFSPLDGKSVSSVMVDHFRNGDEPPGEIAELKVPVFGVSSDPHMHEPSRTPYKDNNANECNSGAIIDIKVG